MDLGSALLNSSRAIRAFPLAVGFSSHGSVCLWKQSNQRTNPSHGEPAIAPRPCIRARDAARPAARGLGRRRRRLPARDRPAASRLRGRRDRFPAAATRAWPPLDERALRPARGGAAARPVLPGRDARERAPGRRPPGRGARRRPARGDGADRHRRDDGERRLRLWMGNVSSVVLFPLHCSNYF